MTLRELRVAIRTWASNCCVTPTYRRCCCCLSPLLIVSVCRSFDLSHYTWTNPKYGTIMFGLMLTMQIAFPLRFSEKQHTHNTHENRSLFPHYCHLRWCIRVHCICSYSSRTEKAPALTLSSSHTLLFMFISLTSVCSNNYNHCLFILIEFICNFSQRKQKKWDIHNSTLCSGLLMFMFDHSSPIMHHLNVVVRVPSHFQCTHSLSTFPKWAGGFAEIQQQLNSWIQFTIEWPTGFGQLLNQNSICTTFHNQFAVYMSKSCFFFSELVRGKLKYRTNTYFTVLQLGEGSG